MEINACIKEAIPPARTPAINPKYGLFVKRVTINPKKAPINIIPSTPRFNIPTLSANISPIVGKSSIVPAFIAFERRRITIVVWCDALIFSTLIYNLRKFVLQLY